MAIINVSEFINKFECRINTQYSEASKKCLEIKDVASSKIQILGFNQLIAVKTQNDISNESCVSKLWRWIRYTEVKDFNTGTKYWIHGSSFYKWIGQSISQYLKTTKSKFERSERIQKEDATPDEVFKLKLTVQALGEKLTDKEIEILVKFKHYYEKNKDTDELFKNKNKIDHGVIPGIKRNLLFVNGMVLIHFNKQKTCSDVKFGGGFGKVGFGIDLRTGNEYAIKAMKCRNIENYRKEDYEHEYKMYSQFNSPNIVETFGYITAPGKRGVKKSYIVLQKMDCDLYKRMKPSSKPALTFKQRKQIAIQVAAGLETMHVKGILHRDVKPMNILLDNEGNARLSDCGSACLTTEKKRLIRNSRTAYYLSPKLHEVVYINKRPCESTEGDDIWALGITFCELFTKEEREFNPALKDLLCSMFDVNETERPTAAEVNQALLSI